MPNAGACAKPVEAEERSIAGIDLFVIKQGVD